MNLSPELQTSPSLGAHVLRAMRVAHAWRPTSFYMLLATPLVLLLAVGLLNQRESPFRLWLGLSLLLLFFGAVCAVALMDFVEITRKRLRAERETFRETLGETDFIAALGQRVREKGPDGR
jgi:hypothetical protein